jgi:hypothetical protein
MLWEARRTNWYQPIYWAIITEVANLPCNRKYLSSTNMLRDLLRRSDMFEGLTTQVLGSFFETRNSRPHREST